MGYLPNLRRLTLAATEKRLYVLIVLLLCGCIVVGLIADGPTDALRGLLRIQSHPARLLNDFTVIGGEGAALINAACVALIGLALVRITSVRLSGPTIAAVFTMLGFGLFGKTLVNALPIIAGVTIAARIAGASFREYILIALFGTALGPLVMALAVETGLATPLAFASAIGGGIVAGIVLPPVAIAMLRLHQGFNLYNIGLTSGFIAVFAASLLVAAGGDLSSQLIVNTAASPVLVFLVPGISLVLIVAGSLAGPAAAFKDLVRIAGLPGRLPSDFVSMVSVHGSLVNMGAMGLLSWGYIVLIGGQIDGPILGAMLTIVGFAAFGKHPRNSWPVLAGVVIACLVFGKDLTAPGPKLAALFALTLAPLAGEFGWYTGIIAGFIHLVMVERTGAWHLGINLYNNGFAGGLTATLLVAIIEWFRSNRTGGPQQAQSRGRLR